MATSSSAISGWSAKDCGEYVCVGVGVCAWWCCCRVSVLCVCVCLRYVCLCLCVCVSVCLCGSFVERAGYPEYREAFETNLTGPRLLSLQQSQLSHMGIQLFQHQKDIMAALRTEIDAARRSGDT